MLIEFHRKIDVDMYLYLYLLRTSINTLFSDSIVSHWKVERAKYLTMATLKLALLLFIFVLIGLETSESNASRYSGVKGAYWPSWLAENLPPSAIPTPYFNRLIYAFVQFDAENYQLSVTEFDEQWMGNFTATIHTRNPPAKAFLCIGGGATNTSLFSNMVSNQNSRATFIHSTISVARQYGFDGLDLDWEFPSNQQDMINLASLFQEWRSAVENDSIASGKRRLLLSAAVYFSADVFLDNVARTYPGDAIREYVDSVNPMCFDYHGGWDTSKTGAHALLYDKSSNVSTSYGISTWKADGVPSRKLVMGMPVYGRTWELEDANDHGIGAPAVGIGPGDQGVMLYKDIVGFNIKNNATVVYDPETVSTYAYAGTNWIGYDDPRSIRRKIRLAKAQGLGGYFFWALGYDENWTLARAASMAWDSKYD
ncbi:class V chitinase CHIT5a-like [Coffea arabica]|uniref:Class V chitinase CHIT5a-like n=1 Tax=Coffea arabica TaxID=13443 RepID=A0A6P6SNB9_COFAR